jgi:hypothetical protein
VTSSRRRFASSYLTTSGCGTTSAGRCLTAERASGREHRCPAGLPSAQNVRSGHNGVRPSRDELRDSAWLQQAVEDSPVNPVHRRRKLARYQSRNPSSIGRSGPVNGSSARGYSGAVQVTDLIVPGDQPRGHPPPKGRRTSSRLRIQHGQARGSQYRIDVLARSLPPIPSRLSLKCHWVAPANAT